MKYTQNNFISRFLILIYILQMFLIFAERLSYEKERERVIELRNNKISCITINGICHIFKFIFFFFL